MITPATTRSCAPPGVVIHAEITTDGADIVMLPTGPTDGIMRAGAHIQLMTPTSRASDPPGALLMPLSWPAVVQLAFTYGPAWSPGPMLTEWISAQVSARTDWAQTELPYIPPEGLTPYSWQADAARMIMAHGVYLEDEPGCGKSASSLLGLANREAAGLPALPVIAVVPTSTIDQWIEHVRRWVPHWRVVAWTGSPAARARLVNAADVYVVGYEMCGRDAGPDAEANGKAPLLNINAASVIADEAHFLKNPNALRSRAVRRLARDAAVFIPLSGTPITHTVLDMYPALSALEPKAIVNRDRYEARYILKTPGRDGEQIIGLNPFREEEFRTILLGRTRRIAKADVLDFLPPKAYTVRTVELPPQWRRAYDDIEAKMLAALPESGVLKAIDVLSQITRLSQLASCAADVETIWEVDEGTGEFREKQKVTLREPSWKVDVLLEILAERRGHPLVCFAVSKPLVEMAGAAAERAGYRVGYIVGGQSRGVRTEAQRAFQAGELDVICVTIASGGTGLDLYTGDCAVFLQRDWSLVNSSQAEDRCFGVGTPVLTPQGWRPIETLSVGDCVITHTGETKSVIDAWSQQSTRMMTEIRITGQTPVTCTADHEFMLRDGTWRAAEHLRPGDWLALPGNSVTRELTKLCFEGARIADTHVNSAGRTQRSGRVKHAPEIIPITDDFLYTLGYFAGDGFSNVDEGKGRFISFSGNTTNKLAALDRCQRWATTMGLSGKRRYASQGTGCEQRYYSAEWAYWFRDAFGHTAQHKKLPKWLFTLNPRQTNVVLAGLSDSDGYHRNGGNRCEYSTTSLVLAAHVAIMVTRAGMAPSVTRGSTNQYIIGFEGPTGPRSAGRVQNVLLRHPKKTNGVRERVYDITVADDKTFVVGGVVVHNCHRLGSERHSQIDIIDIIAKNTIDTRVRQVLREKAGHLSELVQDRRIVTQLLGGASVTRIPPRKTA